MSKGLKKLAALLFMLATVIAFIRPVSVHAAEEMKSVYVQVPADWSAPCAWAWNDDGKNAFAAWPGEAFEKDAANEGWYYIWLPSWANHLIVNANEGTVQTGDLAVEEKNAWVVVTDADNAEVTYDAKTKGEAPAYVEKFTVHATVDASWTNPCLWAWSAPDGKNAFEAWPGEAMKAEENGTYTLKVPTWVNSIIVNANEGNVKTEDLSIDPAELWVTVDADGKAEFSYTDPNAPKAENIKVHVKAPSDWASPCLWAWSAPDGTNAFASWPGEALDTDGDWLVKEIPGWVNSIIVNGNEGGVQTADLSVEAGKEVWIVVNSAEDATVSYEEPKVEAPVASDKEDAKTSAEETKKTDAEKSNNNVGLIIGIVIAVVVIIGVIVAVVVVRKKKQ